MKNILFDSWHQWKVCFFAGLKSFGWGLMRILTCIILGVLSLLRAAWRWLVGFVRANPSAAVVVALFLCFLCWLITFASVRSDYVTIEHQRDSLSYEVSCMKGHCGVTDDGSLLVVDGKDTISYGRHQ